MRTVTVWLLAGTLALASAACGGDDDDGVSTDASAPTMETLAGMTYVSTEVTGYGSSRAPR